MVCETVSNNPTDKIASLLSPNYVSIPGVTVTPSGALHVQGLVPYARHDFGASYVAAEKDLLLDLSVGGTLTPDTTNGGLVLETGTTSGNTVELLSEFSVPYHDNPGHGINGDITFFLEPDSDPLSGDAYIELGVALNTGFADCIAYRVVYDATTDAPKFYTVLRKGNSEIFEYPQEEWIYDPCDGSARSAFRITDRTTMKTSPVALSINMDNLYRVTTELLYAAEQYFGVKTPRGIIIGTNVHEYANTQTKTSFKDSNLHIGLKMSTGTSGANLKGRIGSMVLGIYSSQTIQIGRTANGELIELPITSLDDTYTTSDNLANTETWPTNTPTAINHANVGWIGSVINVKSSNTITLTVQHSESGVWDDDDNQERIITYDPSVNPEGIGYFVPARSSYFLYQLANNSGSSTTQFSSSICHTQSEFQASTLPIGIAITDGTPAVIQKGPVIAKKTGETNYTPVGKGPGGGFQVSILEHETKTPPATSSDCVGKTATVGTSPTLALSSGNAMTNRTGIVIINNDNNSDLYFATASALLNVASTRLTIGPGKGLPIPLNSNADIYLASSAGTVEYSLAEVAEVSSD